MIVHVFERGNELIPNQGDIRRVIGAKDVRVVVYANRKPQSEEVICALNGAVSLQKKLLLQQIWAYLASGIWTAFVMCLFWWLPLGWQGSLGWFFAMLYILPTLFLLQSAYNLLRTLRTLFKVRKVSFSPDHITFERGFPAPSLKVVPRKEEAIVPAILGGLLLLFAALGIFRQAIVPPGYRAIIHPVKGAPYGTGQTAPLPLGAWWELVPTGEVRQVVYGAIYFDAPSGQVFCLRFSYFLTVPHDVSPDQVERKMAGWASSLASSIGDHLYADMPADLPEGNKLSWIENKVAEDKRAIPSLTEFFEGVAENEGLSLKSVRVSFVVLSLAEFRQEYMKTRE